MFQFIDEGGKTYLMCYRRLYKHCWYQCIYF